MLYTNAALHWLGGHDVLFPRLMEQLAPGGVMAVRENVLSNRTAVTVAATAAYITGPGRGWVAEADGAIIGFSIANRSGLIWALFVRPGWDGRGIGTRLLADCIGWLRGIGVAEAFLDTGPGTRAEGFYRHAGWHESARDGENVVFRRAL